MNALGTRRPLFSRPDPFSISPFLALLPVLGDVGKLEALTSALYARYERVVDLQREQIDADSNRELSRRYAAEIAMLRQVLDWLAITPGGGGKE